jgi:hypothetical protein
VTGGGRRRYGAAEAPVPVVEVRVSNEVNRVHHVVWCVQPESLERVRRLWQGALGVTLTDVDLPDLGVLVLVSWEGGLEIMAPTYPTGALAEMARTFLAEHGEGVFSVVFDVADIDDAVAGMQAIGAALVFRDDITPDEFEAREIAGAGTDTPPRQLVRQALFGEVAGIRLCLQQVVAER